MTERTCLTCCKPTAQEQSVAIDQTVQAALSKHLWFSENESQDKIVCCSCWGKIKDFQQFYYEIEQIHKVSILPYGEFVEIKQEQESVQEPADNEDTRKNDIQIWEEGNPVIKTEILDIDDIISIAENDDGDNKITDRESDRGSPDKKCANVIDHKPETEKELSDVLTPQKRRKRKHEQNEQNLKDEEFIAANVNIECDTCTQKFKSFQELQEHSLAKHQKRAFIFCCDKKFTRKPLLVDHIKFHLNPMQFGCDICRKQFRSSRILKGHMERKHSGEEKKYQCSMCPKSFARRPYLNIHERHHRRMGDKKWHCASCDKYYAYESNLRQHIRTVHFKEPRHVCHVCAKVFQTLVAYTTHMESHDESLRQNRTPEERVQCTECSSWVYKKGMRRHMLLHTGTKTCDQCGEECSSALALEYHKERHRKNDLKCSICDKTFKRPRTLMEHMASHKGEKLYRCDFCEKTFNSHANRAAHRKKMHPKEWLEDKIRKNPNYKVETAQS